MSLTLTFPLGDSLRDALDKFKEPLSTIRAVIVGIENEVLVLHCAPIEASENLTTDLTAVHKAVSADVPRFVIVKLEEKSFAQIMFVPEGTKPKVKMLYAGSSAHLREASQLAIATDTHVVAIDEINPTLFGRDIQAERKELYTDDEKVKVAMSKMEITVQQSAVTIATPLDDGAVAAVNGLKDKTLRAASFTVHAKGISVDKTVPIAESESAAWIKILPEDEPRFALIAWKDESIVLLYVCPDSCKPKVKMPYASTKSSFVSQLTTLEAKPRKSVETNTPIGADVVIEESLNGAALEEDVKPIAPKSVMPKGPRMLM